MLEDVAARHGVSPAAAETLLVALVAGGGSQAQFNVPELGGMGQWSRGGMVMVGDMFNTALKARVDALCSELAGLVGDSQAFAPRSTQDNVKSSLFVTGSGGGGGWWPAGLGTPASTGAQNDMRYAFFPEARRLAISVGGRVTVYDTGDHRLGGFSQQQSGDQSLSFTSQHGLVRVAELDIVRPDGGSETPRSEAMTPAGEALHTPVPTQDEQSSGSGVGPSRGSPGVDDVLGTIERLAELHGRGILSKQEFEAKKADLLGRL
jgi:hypothetical protein